MVEQSFVHCDQEILGGTPVFAGTRVPLRNLIDYLEKGHGLDEFLDAFESGPVYPAARASKSSRVAESRATYGVRKRPKRPR